MTNEEIKDLDDRENIFEMSYESRALDMDMLDAPPGHVITGEKKYNYTSKFSWYLIFPRIQDIGK